MHLLLQLGSLGLDDAEPEFEKGDGAADDDQYPQGFEPPGHPEWRRDRECDAGGCRRPVAIVIKTPDIENIFSRVEIGIGGRMSRTNVIPVLVEAVELIGVLFLVLEGIV